MRRQFQLAAALLLLLASAALGQTQLLITSISPSSVVAGSGGFTLTVNGTGFMTEGVSMVTWDGTLLTNTTYVSSTRLTVAINSSLVVTPRTVQVRVTNWEGEVTSNALPLTITVSISSISPTQTTAGASSFTLIVNGSGFVGDGVSMVTWNERLLPFPASVTPTRITVAVDSSLIITPRAVRVQVINSEAILSNIATFTINAAPAITPSSVPIGTVGAVYSQQFVVTGGTAPFTWSFDGSLPPGLLLNNAGLLSGTPTAAGQYTFRIIITDAARVSGQATYTVTVSPLQLSITTSSPLPSATVGVPYSQAVAATGGTTPYTWSSAGSLPAGLVLTGSTISGTPTVASPYTFQVSVNDNTGQTASKVFSLTINAAPLTITTASPLPPATAGVEYSQTFVATGGAPPYVNWLLSGRIPIGLSFTFSLDGGLLSGKTSEVGPFRFTISVTDSARNTVTKPFDLTVSPAALVITTASPLPNATVGSAYTQTFTATGGATPYTWTASTGLPPGLTLSQAGLLSGTPSTPGTYTFTVTVNGAASKQFTLTVTVPPLPALSVTGLDTVNPEQQPSIDVRLGTEYLLEVKGTIRLRFTPDAVVPPADNPQVQFSPGGTTKDFTIPAGGISAFPTSPPVIQTGTVAGRINLTLDQLTVGGQPVSPLPTLTPSSVTIARSAPKINSVRVDKLSSGLGFSVVVTGYSTPRQVTQAVFSFTAASGANLQTTQLTVPVDSAFTTWYSGTSSAQFGSSFVYTQPFTVQGSTTAIGTVSVTLSNSTGSSPPASVSF